VTARCSKVFRTFAAEYFKIFKTLNLNIPERFRAKHITDFLVTLQVNPKIVLEIRVGKAMLSKGLDVIVEDMAFSGLMRVKIKLQIPFPHVEKVEISFLERVSPQVFGVLLPPFNSFER